MRNRGLYFRISLIVISLFILSCAMGPEEKRASGFDGLGQGHATSVTTVITGDVRYQGYTGGEIIVEAREAFPCAESFCPVIEKPPLAHQVLSAPGPYSLGLQDSGENVVIIATYKTSPHGARVAHRWVPTSQDFLDGVNLSLDRPHPPLR